MPITPPPPATSREYRTDRCKLRFHLLGMILAFAQASASAVFAQTKPVLEKASSPSGLRHGFLFVE
jgi:hypothetical protein